MKKEGVIQTLGPIHKVIVLDGMEYFLSIRDQAIVAAKLRWKISNRNIQDKEPFNYKKIKLAFDRLVIYSNLILREGPYRLDCRFRSPIIWYLIVEYKAKYELPEGKTGHIF